MLERQLLFFPIKLVPALLGLLVLAGCCDAPFSQDAGLNVPTTGIGQENKFNQFYGPGNDQFFHRNGSLYVISYDKSEEGAVYRYNPPLVPGEPGSWTPIENPFTGQPLTAADARDGLFGPLDPLGPQGLGSGGRVGSSARRKAGKSGHVTLPAASGTGDFKFILDEYGLLWKFDPGSNAVVGELNFNNSIAGGAATSLQLAVTPDRNFAFITAQSSLPSSAQGSATVLVADLNSFSIVSTITLPVSGTYVPWSPAIAITPDGTLAYVVTQPYSGSGPSYVFVVDVATRVITTTIPVPADSNLGQIAIAPDGAKAYLVDNLDTSAFTIQVLDLQSKTLDTPISIFPTTLNNLIGPSYIALHPDGTRLYFLPLTGGPVQIVSLVTKAVTGTIPLAPNGRPSFGSQPIFTPDGVFLAFMNGPELLVWVNTLTDKVDSTITLPPVPDGAIRNTGFFWIPDH